MKMKWGHLAWVVLAAGACAPETHFLGDGPGGATGEGGESPTGAAGTSIVPNGGSAPQAGSSGGGSAPVAGNVGKAGESQGSGGEPPMPGGECFSPTNHPELAYEASGPPGCACQDEPAECVRAENNGRPWDIALVCTDGHWQGVEDGPCDGGAACTIKGIEYPSGARVPAPFDFCNKCSCDNGEMKDCTQAKCAGSVCPDGTYQARRCTDCGPIDNCAAWEYGCFADPECADGVCSAVRCG
jgi:hypothetical protein